MRSDGTITIGAKIDTKEFDKQIDYIESRMEEIEHLLKQADLGFEVGDTQKLESEYEKLSNKLIDLRKRKKEVLEQPLDDKVSNSNFEKGIEKITKRITRMGLAMIGVRSLYGMISSSASRVAENNEEIKAGMEAVNNVLDNIIGRLLQALLPVINIIAQGISFLAKELFGIDTSSNQFSSNMKSANKSATKLRKQLLGFDELNVLNKDGSIGALSGKTGSKTTTKDYGIYNDMSGLNKNLADLGVVAVYTGDDLKETRLQLEQLIADVKNGKATMTKSNGMITITNKAGRAIKLTTKEYEKLLDDINHSRVTSRNLDIWWKIRSAFQDWNTNQFREEFNNALVFAKNGLEGAVVSYEGNMVKVRLATGQTFTFTKEQWERMNEVAKKSAEGTKTNWFDTINNIINKASGKDQNGLVGAVTGAFDTINKESNKDNNETKTNWIKAANDIILKYTSKDKNGVVGAITGAFNGIPESAETNTKSIFKTITSLINNYKPPTKTIKVNADTSGLEKSIMGAVQGVFITLGIGHTSSSRKGAKGLLFNPPKLARGGIINRPGRGVNYRSATIGERGREAVVPLTDSQQMSLLGQEIAKNVVINLTNVIELDGRVIARNVTQVMNDMNFASNGGVI